MEYDIILAPQAIEDLRDLNTNVRAEVRDAIEMHLRHEPEKVSRSRIKRLHGLSHSQYRLRVGEVRVYYDIVEKVVEILGIVPKSDADEWLKRVGEPDEDSSTEPS
jgi:mRNA interferase RelE/StbE